MSEDIENRRWSIVPMTVAVLLVLGISALVAALAPDQSLGLCLLTLGGSAIVLMALTAVVPSARKYFYSEAEQRVLARNAPAFFLMLAVVWIVPGLLAYIDVVPERAAFSLAFAALWLFGVPVLGWHHGLVVAERRHDRDRPADRGRAASARPAESVEPEPNATAQPKSLAVTLMAYWWSLIPGAIAGALALMAFFQISGELERKQLLEITNTGSRSLNVGEVTLRPGVKNLARLPDGTPIVIDGEEVATFSHRPRTAEVAKASSGDIEFRFTDGPPAGSQTR